MWGRTGQSSGLVIRKCNTSVQGWSAIIHTTNISGALILCVPEGEVGAPGLSGALGTHPLPDGLLAIPGQCQVDAIQCHPVNLLLPAGPVPPHEGVALRAHVLVIAVPVGRGMAWERARGSPPPSLQVSMILKSSEGRLALEHPSTPTPALD